MLFVNRSGAALIVGATIALTVFEVFGILGWLDVKFSAIPAVSLIMSIGIAVEFTAHLVQAYQSSHASDRCSRVEEALTEMALPILNGGLSTLVGLIMLAFSDVRVQCFSISVVCGTNACALCRVFGIY